MFTLTRCFLQQCESANTKQLPEIVKFRYTSLHRTMETGEVLSLLNLLQLEAKVQKAKVGKSHPLHPYCNTREMENNVNTHEKESNEKNNHIHKQ